MRKTRILTLLVLLLICLIKPIDIQAYTTYHPGSYKVFHAGDANAGTYNNFTWKVQTINSAGTASQIASVTAYFKTTDYSPNGMLVNTFDDESRRMYVTGGTNGALTIVSKNTTTGTPANPTWYYTQLNTDNVYKNVHVNATLTVPAYYYYESGGYVIDAPGANGVKGVAPTHAASCPSTNLLTYKPTAHTENIVFRVSLNNTGVLTVTPSITGANPSYDRYTNCSYTLLLKEGFYTVSYSANGGYGSVAANKAHHGANYTVANGSGLTKPGKVFAGWAVNPNATTPDFTSSQATTGTVLANKAGITSQVSGNITLYAVYRDANNAWNYQFTDEETTISPRTLLTEPIPTTDIELKHKITKKLKIDNGSGTPEEKSLEGVVFDLYRKVVDNDDNVRYEPILDSLGEPVSGTTDVNGYVTFAVNYDPVDEPTYQYVVGWDEASQELRDRIIEEWQADNPSLTPAQIQAKYYATKAAAPSNLVDAFTEDETTFNTQAQAAAAQQAARNASGSFEQTYYVKERFDDYEGAYTLINPNADGELPEDDQYTPLNFTNDATVPDTTIYNDMTWESDSIDMDFDMTPVFTYRKTDMAGNPVGGATYRVTSEIPLYTLEEFDQRYALSQEERDAIDTEPYKVRELVTDEYGQIHLKGDVQRYAISDIHYGRAEKINDTTYRYYTPNGEKYLEGTTTDPDSPLRPYFTWCDTHGYAYSFEDAMEPYTSTAPEHAQDHEKYKIIMGVDDDGKPDDTARKNVMEHEYTVTELDAPTGYLIPSNPTVTFTENYYIASDLSDNVLTKENTSKLTNTLSIDGTVYAPEGYLFYTDGETAHPVSLTVAATPGNTISSVKWYKFDEEGNIWKEIPNATSTTYTFNHVVKNDTEGELQYKAVATMQDGSTDESQTFLININKEMDQPIPIFTVNESAVDGDTAWISYDSSVKNTLPVQTHSFFMTAITNYPHKDIDSVQWEKKVHNYPWDGAGTWQTIAGQTNDYLSIDHNLSNGNQKLTDYRATYTYTDGSTEQFLFHVVENDVQEGMWVDDERMENNEAYLSYDETQHTVKMTPFNSMSQEDDENMADIVWYIKTPGANDFSYYSNDLVIEEEYTIPDLTTEGDLVFKAEVYNSEYENYKTVEYTIHINQTPPEDTGEDAEDSTANGLGTVGPTKEQLQAEPEEPDIQPVTANKWGRQEIDITKLDPQSRRLTSGVELTAYYNKKDTLSVELLKQYFNALGGSANINRIQFVQNVTIPNGIPVADVSIKQDNSVRAYWNDNVLYVVAPDTRLIHVENEHFETEFNVPVNKADLISLDDPADEQELMGTTKVFTYTIPKRIENTYKDKVYVDDKLNSGSTEYIDLAAGTLRAYIPRNQSHNGTPYRLKFVTEHAEPDEDIDSIEWSWRDDPSQPYEPLAFTTENATMNYSIPSSAGQRTVYVRAVYHFRDTVAIKAHTFRVFFNQNPPAGSETEQVLNQYVYYLENTYFLNSGGMKFLYLENAEMTGEYGQEFLNDNSKPYEKHFATRAEAEAACNAYTQSLVDAYKQKYLIKETQVPTGYQEATIAPKTLTGNEIQSDDVVDPEIPPEFAAVNGSVSGVQGIDIKKTNPSGERITEDVTFTARYGNPYELDTDFMQAYINALGASNITQIVFTNTPVTETVFADLSTSQDGSVKAYWQDNILYIGTSDSNKVKTNKDLSQIFGAFSMDTAGLQVVDSFTDNAYSATSTQFGANDLVHKLYIDTKLNSGAKALADAVDGYVSYDEDHTDPYAIRLQSSTGLTLTGASTQRRVNGGAWENVAGTTITGTGNIQLDDTYALANDTPGTLEYKITATEDGGASHEYTYTVHLNETAPAGSIADMAAGGIYQLRRTYTIQNVGIAYTYLANAGSLTQAQQQSWVNAAPINEKRFLTQAAAEAALDSYLNSLKVLFKSKYKIEETQHPSMYLEAEVPDVTMTGEQIITRDVVDPFAYGSIKIRKLGEDGTRKLQGVEFALYTTDTEYAQVGGRDNVFIDYDGDGNGTKERYYLLTSKVTGSNGEALFSDVISNFEYRYIIQETRTVDGYMLLKEPINIGIMPVESNTAPALTYTGKYIYQNNKYYYFDLTYEVKNTSVFDIPPTGGLAEYWFYIGILFATLGLLYFVWEKTKITEGV